MLNYLYCKKTPQSILTDFEIPSGEDPTDKYLNPVPWSVKLINSMMTKGQTTFITFKWINSMSNMEEPC